MSDRVMRKSDPERPAWEAQRELMLARAKVIQAKELLPLRDLVQRLEAEGHKTANVAALSRAGLAAENFRPPPGLPPKPADEGAEGEIDASGTPEEITRAMLRRITGAMAQVERDSPAYLKLSAEARQVTKLIAALEEARAGEETAEERERRLRREDGETAQQINRHVDQALVTALTPGEGAPWGRCPCCGEPLTAGGRAALLGGA